MDFGSRVSLICRLTNWRCWPHEWEYFLAIYWRFSFGICFLCLDCHILQYSMDWFKRKSTGNHRFYHDFPIINTWFSCKISLKPIHSHMLPCLIFPLLETTTDFDSAILLQLQKFKKEIPGISTEPMIGFFSQREIHYLGNPKRGYVDILYIYIICSNIYIYIHSIYIYRGSFSKLNPKFRVLIAVLMVLKKHCCQGPGEKWWEMGRFRRQDQAKMGKSILHYVVSWWFSLPRRSPWPP